MHWDPSITETATGQWWFMTSPMKTPFRRLARSDVTEFLDLQMCVLLENVLRSLYNCTGAVRVEENVEVIVENI